MVIPVLERCELDAELQVAKAAHPVLPPLRLGVTLPTLRFFISPARLHRVMRVLAAALPGKDIVKPRLTQHLHATPKSAYRIVV